MTDPSLIADLLVFRLGNGPWLMRVPIFTTSICASIGFKDIVLPQELQAYYNATHYKKESSD